MTTVPTMCWSWTECGGHYLLLVIVALGLTCFCPTGLHAQGDFPYGSSDPLNQGLPEWRLQPEANYYVVRNKPVEITCRATPAIQITFKCAGSQIPLKLQDNMELIDPVTGRKTLQSSITVTREDVDDYYGDDGYWCECYAWNTVQVSSNPQHVKSTRAQIEAAYLKRRFQRIPMSTRVAVQSIVELQCLPPEGKPLPTVFWQKDNVELNVQEDINFIISSEGSLIINQARLQDTGNYTCGAVNQATRRLSDSASLVVYLDGGWSPWSEWSDCSASCGKGKKRRTRTCDDPAPINGGAPCSGESQAFVDCTSLCPVDGAWSPWSPWSSCSPDCRQHRTRSCDSPSPGNGGQFCAGSTNLEAANCTGGMCPAASRAEEDDNIPLYVGLCVAVAVIIIVIIPVIVLLRRKNARDQGVFDMDNGQDASQSLTDDEKKITKNGEMMSMQPDVTQTVVTVQHQHHQQQQPQQYLHHNSSGTNSTSHSADSPNNNHMGTLDKAPPYLPPDPPYSAGGGGSVSPPMSDNLYSVPNAHFSSNLPSPGDVSQCYSTESGRSHSHPHPHPHQHPHPQHPHPQHPHPQHPHPQHPHPQQPHRLSGTLGRPGKTMVVEPTLNPNLDSSMEKLALKDKQAALPPPPPAPESVGPHSRPGSGHSDSLQGSRQSVISVQLPGNVDTEAVTWSTFDFSGGRLVLPESGVMLTVPEGAIKRGHVEEIYMAVCRDDKDRPRLSEHQTILSPVVLVGPPGVVLMKPVILSFQHCASMRQGSWVLSLYRSDSPLDEPPQWRRLVVLGHETINSQVYTQLDPNHCHIMTEYLNRYALIGESVPGGKAVKIYRLAAFAPALPPSMDYSIRVYVVEDTQDALDGVVQVEQRLGGRLVDKPKQIPFQDGGHNLCLTIEELSVGWRSKLAASYQEIPFRHIWSGNQNNLHCSFSLELLERGTTRLACKIQVYQKGILQNRQVLHINTNFKEKATPVQPVGAARSSTVNTNTTNSSSGFSSMVTLDPSAQVFRLPPHIRSQLCMLLDPPNARGNDWRMLAQALTVDRYINYFATKASPTDHILDLWEARHREESAVTDLMNILRVMGRMDAAAVLEKDMGSWL
ncbi:netrin receptor UNC5C-like isoform X3 [Babylonia areolata]|uniref:netrin receptor UNC5C-like isoform X3 n=1 Tax=Babylonia areolata TaxID=304850 RepID=UPI003FD1BF26